MREYFVAWDWDKGRYTVVSDPLPSNVEPVQGPYETAREAREARGRMNLTEAISESLDR